MHESAHAHTPNNKLYKQPMYCMKVVILIFIFCSVSSLSTEAATVSLVGGFNELPTTIERLPLVYYTSGGSIFPLFVLK